MRNDFGPNSIPVSAFLARLPRLTLDDFAAAIKTWRDALRRTDTWYAAEDAVGDALARTRRHDEEWRLHDALHAVFRGAATWHAGGDTEAHGPATEAAAQYLASSAAFALLLIDALSPAHVATLYAPFAALVPLATLGIRAPRAPDRDGRRRLPS